MTDRSERLVVVHEELFEQWLEQADLSARQSGKTLSIDWGEPHTDELTYWSPVITSHDIPVGQVTSSAGTEVKDAQGMTDRTDPA
jgi:hypothetical protein